VTRQVLADHPELMTVAFRFRIGATGKQHKHPHVQSTYVESGRFLFRIAGIQTEVGPGDSFCHPDKGHARLHLP
jgi:quercetin dioxygenase-like cupin family protein